MPIFRNITDINSLEPVMFIKPVRSQKSNSISVQFRVKETSLYLRVHEFSHKKPMTKWIVRILEFGGSIGLLKCVLTMVEYAFNMLCCNMIFCANYSLSFLVSIFQTWVYWKPWITKMWSYNGRICFQYGMLWVVTWYSVQITACPFWYQYFICKFLERSSIESIILGGFASYNQSRNVEGRKCLYLIDLMKFVYAQ
jgi:hypothetical protein